VLNAVIADELMDELEKKTVDGLVPTALFVQDLLLKKFPNLNSKSSKDSKNNDVGGISVYWLHKTSKRSLSPSLSEQPSSINSNNSNSEDDDVVVLKKSKHIATSQELENFFQTTTTAAEATSTAEATT
jgi:hypothetical protein